MIQRLGQLEPTARYIGMGLAADFERDVGSDSLPRLLQAAFAGKDQPGHDEPLCGGTRLRQAALDQRHIQSGLAHRFPHSGYLLA